MSYRLTIAAAAGTILASTALYALFVGLVWFWAGVGAVTVVAAVGLLTRWRPMPVIVCLAAGLAGLIVYLNVLFASARSWLLVVPNPDSLAYVWQVATQGMADADRFSPPVPLTPGLMLLSTAGIGLAAIATDILAVRLRSSAVAGLPLLALFIVPTTTPVARSGLGTAIVFSLGTAGYLVILAADGRERIRVWGRTVGLWRADGYGRPGLARQAGGIKGSDIHSLASAGRRIGTASIVVALCVPLFVPGVRLDRMFPAHVNIFGPAASGAGTGNGATVPDPLAAMTQDLREGQPQPVLTYTSTDPDPQYLQMYVLGDLTTTTWTLSPRLGPTAPANGTLPKAQGLAGASSLNVTTHITFSHTASATSAVAFLPVPYPPTRINVPGHWVIDQDTAMVLGFNNALSGLSYTVHSEDVTPTAQQLSKTPPPPAAIADQYLNVPPAFRSLTALADKITRGGTTAYAKAVLLQQWFTDTGGFTYSLNVSEPANATGLTHFLTVTKRGYCQQFAFAMAVLARLLGIPSRVAVGFTAGTPTTAADQWEVKTSDAHAWPELYFQGAGWLRFEPTPSGNGGQGTATPPGYTVPQTTVAPGSNGSDPGLSQLGTGTSRPRGTGANLNGHTRLPGGGEFGSGKATSGSGFPFEPAGLAVLALLALLAVGPPVERLLRRQFRLGRSGEVERAHAAWRETLDDLTDYHVRRRPSESPRAIASRVAEENSLPPAAAGALSRVALAEERASYAGSPSAAPSRADLDLIRRGLAASVSRRARWRARLAPASAFTPLRAGSSWLADAVSQAQSRVRPHLPWLRPGHPRLADHEAD